MKKLESLGKGASVVADAVKITLGPKGRKWYLKKLGITNNNNDGVSIAKEIELKDKFEALGAELLKEVASKTRCSRRRNNYRHSFSSSND